MIGMSGLVTDGHSSSAPPPPLQPMVLNNGTDKRKREPCRCFFGRRGGLIDNNTSGLVGYPCGGSEATRRKKWGLQQRWCTGHTNTEIKNPHTSPLYHSTYNHAQADPFH